MSAERSVWEKKRAPASRWEIKGGSNGDNELSSACCGLRGAAPAIHFGEICITRDKIVAVPTTDYAKTHLKQEILETSTTGWGGDVDSKTFPRV